jgi:hypothetical protein
MELKIKPHRKNIYPIGGIIIRGNSTENWLLEIQKMQLLLDEITVYALPGNTPKSIFGCLLIWEGNFKEIEIGRNSFCQLLGKTLFIPENAILFPAVSNEEISKIFSGKPHLLHNEIGLVELDEPVNWQEFLIDPLRNEIHIKRPEQPVFIPKQIFSFQVKPVPGEDALNKLYNEIFPKKEEFKDKPLNILEKAKLQILKGLFKKSGDKSKAGDFTTKNIEKTAFGSLLKKIFGFLGGSVGMLGNMQQDFEELEKRNQKEIDKLLNLFKNNPEEALKYSIPLDEHGTGRGGNAGSFNLSKLWSDFSLFGGGLNTGSGSGASVIVDNQYMKLRIQYYQTAQELEKNNDFQKAAFVYLKLLKDKSAAANSLEKGKLYHEAATIFLKHLNQKDRAAECYEKGNMFSEAIELYKELNKHEKVGDLYMIINKRNDAKIYYEKVVEAYLKNKQHVKASFIYSKKTGETEKAQNVLLEGWKNHNDAFNCINNYFANIEDGKVLDNEINKIYTEYTNSGNKITFLEAMKHEFEKAKASKELVKNIAYEIVSEQAKTNPAIVTELHAFNKKDKNLIKDTIRYKLKK